MTRSVRKARKVSENLLQTFHDGHSKCNPNLFAGLWIDALAWSELGWPLNCRRWRAPASSMPLQIVPARQLRELPVRLGLIPKGDRRNVILERQIAAPRLPAERLDRHLEILLEADGIGDVPSIEPEARLRIVEAVGPNHLR